MQLLYESNKKPKRFCEKATGVILTQKDEIKNEKMTRAALLQENILIRKAINKIKNTDYKDTKICAKLVNSQTNGLSCEITITNEDETRLLTATDSWSSQIDLKSYTTIKLIQDNQVLHEEDFYY